MEVTKMTNGDRIRMMNNLQLAALINDSCDFFSCDDCTCKEGSPACIAGCFPFIEEFLNRNEDIDGEDKKYRIYKISHSGRKDVRNKPVDDEKHYGFVDSIIQSPDVGKLKQYQNYYFKFITSKLNYDYWRTSGVIEIVSLVSSTENKPKYMLETVNTLYYLEEI